MRLKNVLAKLKLRKKSYIVLRNLLLYKLREHFLLFEKRVCHQSKLVASMEIFKATYNQSIAKEVKHLMYRLHKEGKLGKFD